MGRKAASSEDVSPNVQLERLVSEALGCATKASRHNQSLSGNNFYGNKLASLRADATNLFSDIASTSAGDTSATAELIETVFAASTTKKNRSEAARDLMFSLRTKHRATYGAAPINQIDLFPQTLLVKAKRGYIVTIGRQMNACYAAGWLDACAVMLRRLLEICIIEAFEKKGIQAKITDANGNYVQLTELISLAMAERAWSLSRNTKTHLPKLRDIGHMSAHGRYFTTQRPDIENVKQGARIVIEEFLHHAELI